MRQALIIGWNKEYVKKLSKKDFIKEFSTVYPAHDLEAEYDKIVPPKKQEEAK